MKTLIDISREKIEQARQIGKFETIKETIETAIDEYIRRSKLDELADQLGSFSGFATAKELKAIDEKDSTRIFGLD